MTIPEEISTSYQGLCTRQSRAYNTNGTVACTTNSNGAKTYYRYDSMNRMTEQWTQIDETTYAYSSTTYDKNGQVVATLTGIDPVVLWATPSQTITAEVTYYANGLRKTVADGQGRITRFFYDADNRLIRTEKQVSATEMRVTENEYDANGRVTATILFVRAGDIEGYDFTNDTLIQLTSTQTYDPNGNVITSTNAPGHYHHELRCALYLLTAWSKTRHMVPADGDIDDLSLGRSSPHRDGRERKHD